MSMLNANVERQYGETNGLHMAGQAAWGLHMAAQGVPMAAHGVHMAAQRLLLGALGAAYGCSEAPYGCPWGSIWLLRGCIWLQRGCILLGPSMGPMRQICSICCIWLGQAGVQDGSNQGQVMVSRAVWGP